MMKQYLYLLSCYLVYIITLFGMAIESGWFDFETLLKREDIEIYRIPTWQYVVYNCTFFGGLILFIFLFIQYCKYATSSIIEFINFIVCSLLFLILVVLFVATFAF